MPETPKRIAAIDIGTNSIHMIVAEARGRDYRVVDREKDMVQLGLSSLDGQPLTDDAIQPSSVDLHVDRYFRVFRNDTTPYIDPKQHQEDLTEFVEVDDGKAFILHPGEFVLGSTRERVDRKSVV